MSWHVGKLLYVAAGAFGATVGLRIVTGPKARKVYTEATAFALREKDRALKTYTEVKEACGDIYADALEINEALSKKERAELVAHTPVSEE